MLRTIDLDKNLEKVEYKEKLIDCQLRMRELTFRLYEQKRSMVVVVEGWDAAGKGGAIRRVTERLDPRGYKVYSIGAPEGEDRTHHYLWRFWRRLLPPDDKQLVIFDRSWYGRVLVERIEGFASDVEWKRAFREINEFERQLTDFGMMLVKLWFHISEEEQLSRFQAREKTLHKSWKLTDEDWRNREKWSSYEEALVDLLRRTSTLTAPWTIIEGNDKYWARIKMQQTLINALESGLGVNEEDAQPLEVAQPEKGEKESKKKKKK